MGIYAIGVDILEAKRIKDTIGRYPGFIKRIYTENEIKYCESKLKTKYLHYAVRFTAKEAVAKSLTEGIGKNISFKEIELDKESTGAPYIKLYGNAHKWCKKLKVREIKISVSMTEKYAAAFATSIL